MSDRVFRTSAGQEIVVPSDEPDTLAVLQNYVQERGLGLEEITPRAEGANPLNSILNIGASTAINRGANTLVDSIVGSGASTAAPTTALASTAAENAAFNAAAMEATPATGLFSAPYAAPAGAAGLYFNRHAADP